MKLLKEIRHKDIARKHQSQYHTQYTAERAHEKRLKDKRQLNQPAFAPDGSQQPDLLPAFDHGACTPNGERRDPQQERQANHAQQYVTEEATGPTYHPD